MHVCASLSTAHGSLCTVFHVKFLLVFADAQREDRSHSQIARRCRVHLERATVALEAGLIGIKPRGVRPDTYGRVGYGKIETGEGRKVRKATTYKRRSAHTLGHNECPSFLSTGRLVPAASR